MFTSFVASICLPAIKLSQLRFTFVFPVSVCAEIPPHAWSSQHVASCSGVDSSNDFRVPSDACSPIRLSFGSPRLTDAYAGASSQPRCGSSPTGCARSRLCATRVNSADWSSFKDLCAPCSRGHRSAGSFQAVPGYVASRIDLWTSFDFALTSASVL